MPSTPERDLRALPLRALLGPYTAAVLDRLNADRECVCDRYGPANCVACRLDEQAPVAA